MTDANSTTAIPVETGTTSDERTMAVLAQVLQLVGGWIAPLVIFFVKRQSRFITFHALQVLLFQGLCLFLEMLAVGACFTAITLGISLGGWSHQHESSNAPPLMFFLFISIFMLSFMVLWLMKLLLAVIYGIKAGRGEWAEYPLLGRLSRKILNIGPGGSAATP
ncbi:MAG TPA: DUF4870 domain-containing protein [Candidatus Sulfotelmatobacter sp.]|nr:DUF4870 domain-containing protein [Candidatus Sulfotelmatobacter sp.]